MTIERMTFRPPPGNQARELQTFIPGLWPWFVWSANGALDSAPPDELFSWYRTISHNREVKGARFSQHLLGLALDMSPDPKTEAAFRAAGWIAVPEGDHLHVQVYPAGTLPAWLFARISR